MAVPQLAAPRLPTTHRRPHPRDPHPLRRRGGRVFYDICFFPKGACWSPESCKFRDRQHLNDDSLAGFERCMAKAHETFSKRYWDLIRAARPDATVFFNAGSDTFLEPGLGGRARFGNMSHMEIESLPSGFWGYYHFPRLARSNAYWGKPWLGMTGRLQTL